VLDQAHAGTLPGLVRTGVTFADVCAEYLRYVEHDLDRKPSTVGDYRSAIRAHLVPAFGSLRLEDVTADRIEAWKATLRVGNRTKIKLLTVLNGVLVRARRVHRLRHNPMADVEKPRHRQPRGRAPALAARAAVPAAVPVDAARRAAPAVTLRALRSPCRGKRPRDPPRVLPCHAHA
jgi:hypothetical protein